MEQKERQKIVADLITKATREMQEKHYSVALDDLQKAKDLQSPYCEDGDPIHEFVLYNQIEKMIENIDRQLAQSEEDFTY